MRSLLDDLLSGGSDIDETALEEIESQVEAWGTDYSEMVATAEIHAAVEEAVVDEMKKQGVQALYWNTEPDACPRCVANAEASPVRIGEDFPDGDTVPPAHPRCRCTTSPV